jgi:hypothetical protein
MTRPGPFELTTLQIYAKMLKHFMPAKNEETTRFLADVRSHLESESLGGCKPFVAAYERCWVKK